MQCALQSSGILGDSSRVKEERRKEEGGRGEEDGILSLAGAVNMVMAVVDIRGRLVTQLASAPESVGRPTQWARKAGKQGTLLCAHVCTCTTAMRRGGCGRGRYIFWCPPELDLLIGLPAQPDLFDNCTQPSQW